MACSLLIRELFKISDVINISDFVEKAKVATKILPYILTRCILKQILKKAFAYLLSVNKPYFLHGNNRNELKGNYSHMSRK